MIEIVIHGLGGQGAVTASQLIAVAAFYDGKESQGFPMFGVERQGTPVQAFVRISDKKIRLRSQIYKPDYNIVLDPRLLKDIKHGKIIANTKSRLKEGWCFYAGVDFINTKMVAYFSKVSKLISKKSLLKAIEYIFENKPGAIKKNKKIVEEIL